MNDAEALRGLHVNDLIALITVLRRDYAAVTVAADAAAEAVGNMAEYVSRTIVERDRLRAVVDAARRANHLYWIAESADFDNITPVTVAMTKVELMLDQLDASPTGEDT